jgi:hypothetical protein
MSGTIWLIAEDESDGQIVQALLDARQVKVRVRVLVPTGGSGGISRLARQLPRLIEQAKANKQRNDCIAVLHDADEHTQQARQPYNRVKEICEQHSRDVILVIARDEIEAWLLADPGLCGWLGVKAGNCDGQSKPSETLNSLLKSEKGMKYQGPARDKVLVHLDGGGDQHSPSLRAALAHLDGAPCVDAAP